MVNSLWLSGAEAISVGGVRIGPNVTIRQAGGGILSLDDLIMTQFVAGGQSQTLPMLVYSSVRLGVDPQINVLATVIVAIAATALIISGRLTRQR